MSGGSDAKIKIWDLHSKTPIIEIVGHKTPVGMYLFAHPGDMILIENPFDLERPRMFSIVSVGTGDDVIRVSSSISPINNGTYIQEKVSCDFGATTSPLMQVIRD